MNDQIEIKVLNGKDAKNFVDPFYKANNKPHSARDTDIFFCAFISNQIIGTVRFCTEENTSLLRSMLIHENYRFQRIGHSLLKEFESHLIAHNIQDTFCIPYTHLLKFYGLIGFEEINANETPEFLYQRFLSYLEKYPDNSYSMMIRKS
jgi:N-acetylglutamate synthase-like GNAT family acetyltransferase